MTTIKIPLISIMRQAQNRPAFYYEDCVNHGVVVDGSLIMDLEQYQKLCEKYRGKNCPGCQKKTIP